MKSQIFVLLFVIAIAAAEFHPNYVQKPLPDGRIVGGKDADIADFKYQVSLQQFGRHMCGGAIIASNWIITAAHCLQGYIPVSALTFRIGSSIHDKNGQIVKAAQIFNHPNFNMKTMQNDVALVRTQTPMSGVNIQKIGIPALNEQIITGSSAMVSGWGYLSENSMIVPSNLQYTQVNVVDQNVCHKSLAMYGGVDATMFCAMSRGKDACQGDSGGPILIGGKLTGVVSWGIGCANPSYPGVYTRLSNPIIRSWIQKISGI